MIIDAHQHFWRAGHTEHDWRSLGLDALSRDFREADLEPLLRAATVDATVVVQSAHRLSETTELLELAAHTPFVAGVVGWVPLTDPAETDTALRRLSGRSQLRGVRHLTNTKSDPDWLVHPEVIASLRVVAEHALTFDAVPVSARQLEHVGAVAELIPDLRIVVDHLARPPVDSHGWQPWASLLENVATRPNVAAKVSAGLDVVQHWQNWRTDDFQPYLDHAVVCFGADRLMAASNWPVVLLADDYQTVWSQLRHGLAGLSGAAQRAVLGGTAVRWYDLQPLTCGAT